MRCHLRQHADRAWDCPVRIHHQAQLVAERDRRLGVDRRVMQLRVHRRPLRADGAILQPAEETKLLQRTASIEQRRMQSAHLGFEFRLFAARPGSRQLDADDVLV